MSPQVPEKSHHITFDIECTGLNPWYGDYVTCICAMDSNNETYQICSKKEQEMIHGFLDWVFLRSPEAYFLVTKNGRMFDVPFLCARLVLSPGTDKESNSAIQRLLSYDHFDLQDLTQKWVSLSDWATILKATPKLGDGMNAIRLWDEGRRKELLAYCMQDVETTDEVFLKWRG